jgi:hypothetical protein
MEIGHNLRLAKPQDSTEVGSVKDLSRNRRGAQGEAPPSMMAGLPG